MFGFIVNTILIFPQGIEINKMNLIKFCEQLNQSNYLNDHYKFYPIIHFLIFKIY